MISVVSVGNGSSGGECYFIACDSSANHCPQFSYLSLNDAIWTFSKAIVFTEGKNLCLTTCLSDRVLSVYFGFLYFLSKTGILLFKSGTNFLKNSICLKVRILFQPLSKNSTTLNSPEYFFINRSFSLKVSLLSYLHRGKYNYCKH